MYWTFFCWLTLWLQPFYLASISHIFALWQRILHEVHHRKEVRQTSDWFLLQCLLLVHLEVSRLSRPSDLWLPRSWFRRLEQPEFRKVAWLSILNLRKFRSYSTYLHHPSEIVDTSFCIWVLENNPRNIFFGEISFKYIFHFNLDSKRPSSGLDTTYGLWVQLVRKDKAFSFVLPGI